MTRFGFVIFAAAILLQGAPAPQGSPAAQDRADARSAIQAGDFDRAHRLLLQSLEREPDHPEALRDLIRVSDAHDKSGNAGVLWRSALAAATADENGNIKFDGENKPFLKADGSYKSIVAARADLAREISRVSDRAAGARSLLKWMREVLAELARKQPPLRRKFLTNTESEYNKSAPAESQVISALLGALERALAGARFEEAARIALALRGLASQAGYKDLMTPAPDMRAAAAAAAAGLGRAREMLKSKAGDPPSIDFLEKLTIPEREEFTKTHNDPGNPGVTQSPEQFYRIETVCGIDTLLATAKQVEYHHKRIAKWAGSDPFAGRQGIVRIVPRQTDLDAEGSPFWWAGGFQGGDVTTLHFAHGTPGGLGRGLTHELTHRFDGALYPGMPGWLAEGRAVWTGGAYGNITDDVFVESYASFGALSDTFWRGRGSLEYLQKLLTGTMEDYRDNYTAGHALWVYLFSWSPDNKIFRPQLQKYMTGLKTQKNAVEWFEQCFADGKAGRPQGMKAFAKEYNEFLKGFWWESIADFTKRYTGGVAPTQSDSLIYDSPTWHSDRAVAERYFGAAHATEAARIFTKLGDIKNAIAAWEWSFTRDEMTREGALELAQLYEKSGKFDAAFAVRARAWREFPVTIYQKAPAPVLQILSGVDARAGQLFKALASAAEAEKAAGHADAAAALAAEHNRLALFFAKPPLSGFEFTDPASRPARPLHPLCDPPQSLTIHGMKEERLAGFDNSRAAGLWAVSPGGDVLLGRKEFTAQTGQQREAWYAETFTHGNDWFTGQYTIKSRVKILTSWANGALILGYQRHDRAFYVNFSCGDASNSARPDKVGTDSVIISIGDSRDREPMLPNGKNSARISVNKDNPSFLLEVRVDGPAVHVYANQEYLGTHTAASGIPVEGFVGFGSHNGVLQFETPTVQIHHRAGSPERCGCTSWPDGVDLNERRSCDWFGLVGQRASGFDPGPSGAALLWCPNLKGINTIADDPSVDLPAEAAAHFIQLRAKESLESIPIIVALPDTLTADEFQRLKERLKPQLGARDQVVMHHGHAGYDAWRASKLDPSAFYDPFLLFVDPNGYIRTRERYRMDPSLPVYFKQWARLSLGGY